MNLRSIGLGFLLLFLASSGLKAQFQQVELYPQLSGQSLLDQLVTDYKPDTVMEFGAARDTLFGRIYLERDSVICVYTRHGVFLPPGQDPTQAVFLNGSADGINTEHTWPQALGAGAGNARADMHHLYPSKVNVNTARANSPFGEILDVDTEVWYFKRNAVVTIPTQNIDEYSESGFFRFEPREDHKGNVARAMFYFYTMYRAEVDAQDPTYFNLMRETLCRWHHEDPVDELEWRRSMMIARYQDDKANPFVLDCTLPQRTYCDDQPLMCEITSTREPLAANFTLFANRPNPFSGTTQLAYQLRRPANVRLSVRNLLGQQVAVLVDEQQAAGTYELDWQSPGKGVYLYQLEVEQDGQWTQQSGRMISLD